MRAARLHAVGDLRVAEEPRPEAEPGTSLVRVTAVGVCGSDLHWWDEAGIGDAVLRRPLVLGHEAAGVIEDGPRRGQRVAIDPAIPCWRCPSCRAGYRNLCTHMRFAGHGVTDGAMRDFIAWPDDLLPALPDALSDADGATLEPLGVAIHALDLGHVRLGAATAVAGLGPIGLLLVQVLRAAGAGTVVGVDPLPHRREAALALGADVAVGPEEASSPERLRGLLAAAMRAAGGGGGTAPGPGSVVPGPGSGVPGPEGVMPGPGGGVPGQEGMPEGVDVSFEMAGTDGAVGVAMTAARPGGRVVLGGIPAGDRTTFTASLARRKGLTIAMVRRMNEVYPRAIALAASGRVDLKAVVTHTFPLGRSAEAFAVAARREGLKVVIEPGT